MSVPPDSDENFDRRERLGQADLDHINQYTKNRMLTHGYTIPFRALSDQWVEAISPGVPDGR